ncbi:MAG: formylglycine-generating enzyme family protein [Nitrospirales bacterium]|nr:formylglycine-generating enzyme family protein [Nitrospira sp.]MDR4499858.1 formylglycine-generating enzyme family protein [Nitrospirales bacterium]
MSQRFLTKTIQVPPWLCLLWAVVLGVFWVSTASFAGGTSRSFQVLPPLVNEVATHDAILELIQGELVPKVQVHDRVVVYFPGHGVKWLMAAGGAGQEVLELGKRQHGAFTYTGNDGAPIVLIPEGAFWMGSTSEEVESVVKECMGYDFSEERCRGWFKGEMPRHRVSLKTFYIDTHEVTNRLFQQFVTEKGYTTTAEREGESYAFVEGEGWKPVKGASWRKPEGKASVFASNRENHPVVLVSWDDAKAYCDHYGQRLPTEAEWEYAARAGTETRNWWGNGYAGARRVANIADQSARGLFKNSLANYNDGFERTAPVGVTAANPWGLYDMIGNVWEWTVDWYDNEHDVKSPQANPGEPAAHRNLVIRGGSWDNEPINARSANRYRLRPMDRAGTVGFRCVQDVCPQSETKCAR